MSPGSGQRRSPLLHLIVAFATVAHATSALEFLAQGSLPISASPRPVAAEGDLALVDIEIPIQERSRLATLLGGVHALVIEESAGLGALIA